MDKGQEEMKELKEEIKKALEKKLLSIERRIDVDREKDRFCMRKSREKSRFRRGENSELN